MPLFHSARHPPQWLRIALASLMLAFALNSVAHVTHRHDPSAQHQLHHALCGYCISFDNMSPTPAAHAFVVPASFTAEVVAAPFTVVAARFSITSAQPRAPPRS